MCVCACVCVLVAVCVCVSSYGYLSVCGCVWMCVRLIVSAFTLNVRLSVIGGVEEGLFKAKTVNEVDSAQPRDAA